MGKTFYTDHDIEDLAKQGVQSIDIGDDIVLTDLAVDKARRLGITLVTDKEKERAKTAPPKQPKAATKIKPASSSHSNRSDDLEGRVFKAVKSRLGDQVDNALLRTIVKRVVQSINSRKTS